MSTKPQIATQNLTNDPYLLIPYEENQHITNLFDDYFTKFNTLYNSFFDNHSDTLSKVYLSQEELKETIDCYQTFYDEYGSMDTAIKIIYKDPEISRWVRIIEEYRFVTIVTRPDTRGSLLARNYLSCPRSQDLKHYVQDSEVELLHYLAQLHKDWKKTQKIS